MSKTMLEAVAEADTLRLNTLNERQKLEWVHRLDCEIAEMMEVEAPEFVPGVDRELLMQSPYDDIYPLYVIALIDYWNEETLLYQNDMVVFNAELAAAKAYWRRHNRPSKRERAKVLR